MPPGEYDGYVTSKQKLCTLDAKSTYCNCMTEMHTAGIWDPILDNYPKYNVRQQLIMKSAYQSTETNQSVKCVTMPRERNRLGIYTTLTAENMTAIRHALIIVTE